MTITAPARPPDATQHAQAWEIIPGNHLYLPGYHLAVRVTDVTAVHGGGIGVFAVDRKLIGWETVLPCGCPARGVLVLRPADPVERVEREAERAA